MSDNMQDCPLYDWVMDLVKTEMKKPKSAIENIEFSDFNAPITIDYLGRKFALNVTEITPIADTDFSELDKVYPKHDVVAFLAKIGISAETAKYAEYPVFEDGIVKFMSYGGISDIQQANEFEKWMIAQGWQFHWVGGVSRVFNLPPIYDYRLAKITGTESEWWECMHLKPGVLTLEQFRASRKEIDASDDDFEQVYGETARGFSYADGEGYIQELDDQYYLIIHNMQFTNKNLSELEEELYFDFYLSEHNN